MFTIFFALCPLNISSTCNSLKPLKESIFRDTKGHGQEHPLLYQANQSHLYSLNHLIQYIYTKQVFSFSKSRGVEGGVTNQLKYTPTAQSPLALLQPVLPVMDPLQQSSQPRLPRSPCCYLTPVSLLWEIQIIKSFR